MQLADCLQFGEREREREGGREGGRERARVRFKRQVHVSMQTVTHPAAQGQVARSTDDRQSV